MTYTEYAETSRAVEGLRLGVIATHPVHYFVPLYSELSRKTSACQVAFIEDATAWRDGHFDAGFSRKVKWDVPLLDGYDWIDGRFESTGSLRSMAVQSRQIRRFLASWVTDFSPDVVLVPGWAPIYVVCALKIHAMGVPIVIRPEARVPVSSFRWRTLFRRLFVRKASTAAVIGSASRDELRRLGMSDRQLFHSPYAIEEPPELGAEEARQSRRLLRMQLGLSDEDVIYLFVGKLARYKGVERLLKAFAPIGRSRQRAKLLVVGDGPDRDDLLELALTLGIDSSVRWTGFVNQKDLHDYYRACDVFVLFSDETWGLVVNEAMAHGLPCIVSIGAGVSRDLVSHGLTGFRVNPASEDEGSRYILEMLDAEKRGYMSARATEMAQIQTIGEAAKGIVEAATHAKRCGGIL